MQQWRNWSGRRQTSLQSLCFIRSEKDAIEQIRAANENGRTIRAAGAGHSHSPIVINDDVIMDTSGLAGVSEVSPVDKQAWVRAGTPIYMLGGLLHDHGLALKNQGDIDRQLLAGAISTGTHGTGRALQNIAASVVGLKVITADGEQIECSRELEPELFEVARLSVGSVGLLTDVKMQLEDSSVLLEQIYIKEYEAIADRLPEMAAEHDRFEFFWYPGNDEANVKIIDATSEPPNYPLAEEGSRQSWSFEVLPSHRPHLHTEMEYSVPEENGPKCFAEIRDLLRDKFPDVQWPVEYRTVAEDDIWLSMASNRATVTISVHQDIRIDEEPYYRACEEIFLAHGGRPHWGKVNYLDADGFSRAYPKWHDWWQIRDRFDPKGTFLNEYMKGIRPSNL